MWDLISHVHFFSGSQLPILVIFATNSIFYLIAWLKMQRICEELHFSFDTHTPASERLWLCGCVINKTFGEALGEQ